MCEPRIIIKSINKTRTIELDEKFEDDPQLVIFFPPFLQFTKYFMAKVANMFLYVLLLIYKDS